MPLHDYRCPTGHIVTAFCKVADLDKEVRCELHESACTRVFLSAPFGLVDIPAYQSPIDGTTISSRKARINDLRRSNSVAWEPGINEESARRRAADEQQLDRAVDHTVDKFIAELPARGREQLDSEMRAGADLSFARNTGVA